MSEAKSCIKWLAFYYLLLAVGRVIAIGLIPSVFLTNHFDSLYFLTLSICLFLHYYLRVAGQKYLRTVMLHLSLMIFLLFLFRASKYSVFGNVSALGRYTWYLYYLPKLSMPLLLLYIALLVNSGDESRVFKKWTWLVIAATVLILFVVTNDFHQQIFRFQPGFVNWDGDYAYSWGFIVINVWEYLLYLAAVVILIARCVIANTKQWSWLIFVPFAIGIGMLLLLVTDTMPSWRETNLVQFPEAVGFMVAGGLECCMCLGFIPTNEKSENIFRISSLPVQITDLRGETAYRSATASVLSEEQFRAPDGARIEEHTVLRRMKLPNGFGFWQDDVTELDCLNEELEEAKQRLSEETEMIRLQNELEKEQEEIDQRSFVYDMIAIRTGKESQMISALAEEACASSDPVLIDRNRKQIVFLGAYIKRYANLLLLAADHENVDVGELVLAFSEVLRYLNRLGVSVEVLSDAVGIIKSSSAIAAFEIFQSVLEENYSDLAGVAVHISDRENAVLCRLTLEGIQKCLSESQFLKLSDIGIETKQSCEEEITYLSFLLPGGGEER